MINLRPHHLICMKFYEGKGYSRDFILNMDKITEQLKNNPDAEIKLSASCDDLCSHCPHKTNDNGCSSGQKVSKLDSSVLSYFNIENDRIYKYSCLKNIIDSSLTPETFKNICSDCEWYKAKVCRLD